MVVYVTCQQCKGEGGWIDEDGLRVCGGCGGLGRVPFMRFVWYTPERTAAGGRG